MKQGKKINQKDSKKSSFFWKGDQTLGSAFSQF